MCVCVCVIMSNVVLGEGEGKITAIYTASPQPSSGGCSTSPTLLIARQQPEVGFLQQSTQY